MTQFKFFQEPLDKFHAFVYVQNLQGVKLNKKGYLNHLAFLYITGEVDDEDDSIPQDRDWTAYWRLLFRKITTDDIDDFKKNYKGKNEENVGKT